MSKNTNKVDVLLDVRAMMKSLGTKELEKGLKSALNGMSVKGVNLTSKMLGDRNQVKKDVGDYAKMLTEVAEKNTGKFAEKFSKAFDNAYGKIGEKNGKATFGVFGSKKERDARFQDDQARFQRYAGSVKDIASNLATALDTSRNVPGLGKQFFSKLKALENGTLKYGALSKQQQTVFTKQLGTFREDVRGRGKQLQKITADAASISKDISGDLGKNFPTIMSGVNNAIREANTAADKLYNTWSKDAVQKRNAAKLAEAERNKAKKDAKDAKREQRDAIRSEDKKTRRKIRSENKIQSAKDKNLRASSIKQAREKFDKAGGLIYNVPKSDRKEVLKGVYDYTNGLRRLKTEAGLSRANLAGLEAQILRNDYGMVAANKTAYSASRLTTKFLADQQKKSVSLRRESKALRDRVLATKQGMLAFRVAGKDASKVALGEVAAVKKALQARKALAENRQTRQFNRGNSESAYYQRLSGEVARYTTALKDLGRTTRETQAKTKQGTKTTIANTAATNNAITATKQLGKETGKTGQLINRFFSYAIGYGAMYRALGSVNTLTVGVVELEASLKSIQAVTGTTNEGMKVIEETIKRTALMTKFGTTEIAKAAKVLAQSGVDPVEFPTALPAVATFANATEASIETAADLVSTMRNVYKELDDLTIANQLTKAVNISKLTAEDLKTILSRGLQVSKEYNLASEQFLSAATVLRNAGVKASTVATGFRQGLRELLSPDAKTIKVLKKSYRDLGEQLGTQAIKSRFFEFTKAKNPLLKVLREYQKLGFVGTNKVKFGRIFDVRAMNTISAMISNLDELERAQADIVLGNAALDASKTQMESLQASVQNLGAAITALSYDVTEEGIGSLENFADAATVTVEKLVALDAYLKSRTGAGLGTVITGGIAASATAAYLASTAGGGKGGAGKIAKRGLSGLVLGTLTGGYAAQAASDRGASEITTTALAIAAAMAPNFIAQFFRKSPNITKDVLTRFTPSSTKYSSVRPFTPSPISVAARKVPTSYASAAATGLGIGATGKLATWLASSWAAIKKVPGLKFALASPPGKIATGIALLISTLYAFSDELGLTESDTTKLKAASKARIKDQTKSRLFESARSQYDPTNPPQSSFAEGVKNYVDSLSDYTAQVSSLNIPKENISELEQIIDDMAANAGETGTALWKRYATKYQNLTGKMVVDANADNVEERVALDNLIDARRAVTSFAGSSMSFLKDAYDKLTERVSGGETLEGLDKTLFEVVSSIDFNDKDKGSIAKTLQDTMSRVSGTENPFAEAITKSLDAEIVAIVDLAKSASSDVDRNELQLKIKSLINSAQKESGNVVFKVFDALENELIGQGKKAALPDISSLAGPSSTRRTEVKRSAALAAGNLAAVTGGLQDTVATRKQKIANSRSDTLRYVEDYLKANDYTLRGEFSKTDVKGSAGLRSAFDSVVGAYDKGDYGALLEQGADGLYATTKSFKLLESSVLSYNQKIKAQQISILPFEGTEAGKLIKVNDLTIMINKQRLTDKRALSNSEGIESTLEKRWNIQKVMLQGDLDTARENEKKNKAGDSANKYQKAVFTAQTKYDNARAKFESDQNKANIEYSKQILSIRKSKIQAELKSLDLSIKGMIESGNYNQADLAVMQQKLMALALESNAVATALDVLPNQDQASVASIIAAGASNATGIVLNANNTAVGRYLTGAGVRRNNLSQTPGRGGRVSRADTAQRQNRLGVGFSKGSRLAFYDDRIAAGTAEITRAEEFRKSDQYKGASQVERDRFDRSVDDTKIDVNRYTRLKSDATDGFSQKVKQGLNPQDIKTGVDNLSGSLENLDVNVLGGVVQGIDDLGTAFGAALTGGESFGKGMAKVLKGMALQFIAVTAKALFLKAVTSMFGFSDGGKVEAKSGGGEVGKYSNGGLIRGPGTGTSDSIPGMVVDGNGRPKRRILVSNGESILTAKVTRALGMDTINSLNKAPLRASVGGIIHGGGVTKTRPGRNIGGSVVYQSSLKINASDSGLAPEKVREFGRMVDSKIKSEMVTQLRPGGLLNKG